MILRAEKLIVFRSTQKHFKRTIPAPNHKIYQNFFGAQWRNAKNLSPNEIKSRVQAAVDYEGLLNAIEDHKLFVQQHFVDKADTRTMIERTARRVGLVHTPFADQLEQKIQAELSGEAVESIHNLASSQANQLQKEKPPQAPEPQTAKSKQTLPPRAQPELHHKPTMFPGLGEDGFLHKEK